MKIQIQPSLTVKSGVKDINVHVATENENHMTWVQASTAGSNKGGLVSYMIVCIYHFNLFIMALICSYYSFPTKDFGKNSNVT